MTTAQLGIAAALQSTGEVSVIRYALPAWGLTTGSARSFLRHEVGVLHPQLVIGTWSGDAPAAKAHPSAYQAALNAAVKTILMPGDGVLGVIFLQLPTFGSQAKVGPAAWNEAAEQSSVTFPGRVMFLPVGSSVEIDGRFTSWLPPLSKAAKSPKDWVRVRASDGVQLCPPGITRYTAPILEDMTRLFHLSPAGSHWWESYAVTVQALGYQGAVAVECPNDHPGRA